MYPGPHSPVCSPASPQDPPRALHLPAPVNCRHPAHSRVAQFDAITEKEPQSNMEHRPADSIDPQPQSTAVLTATAMPARRRSKMACDTCHYRKIKCNVEKCYPCKNCDKNAVQCTMVGPSMRPPRSISGSSSAAAAAAVAMAMATVANARFSNAGFAHGLDGPLDQSRSSSPRLIHSGDERGRLAARVDEFQQPGLFNPLMRRSSASAQIMDDGSGSSDLPRHRRKLQSYSSSPSSLRNLFIMGGSSLRSPSTFSTSYHHPDTPPGMDRHPSVNTTGVREPLSAEAKGFGSYDYFNLPLSHSAGSTPSVSSPSCTSVSRGMTQFNPFDDSRLASSSTQALSPSLPPTPTNSNFEKSNAGNGGDNLVSPTSPYDVPVAPFRPRSIQNSHRSGIQHPLQPVPRRTAGSSYLNSQYAGSVGANSQLHHHLSDRRSSLPWDTHISTPSPSQHAYETRPHTSATSQQGYGMFPPTAPGQPLFKNQQQAKDPGFKAHGHPQNPQGFLMRSNSTPAIFSSPSRPLEYSLPNKQDYENSMTSHSRPTENSLGGHDVPFSQQFDPRSERPGHPLEIIVQGHAARPAFLHLQNSHTQQQQQQQQQHQQQQQPQFEGDWSNQYTQQEDIRGPTPVNSGHRPELSRYSSNVSQYSESVHSATSRSLKVMADLDRNNLTVTTINRAQDMPSPFFVASPQHQQQHAQPQDYDSTHNIAQQQLASNTGWSNTPTTVDVHRPSTSSENRTNQQQHGQHPTIQGSAHLSATQAQLVQQHQRIGRQSAPSILLTTNRKLDQQQQPQQRHQAMKVEPMDEDAFDSSLAMVLDDHLSLMDHLNMIPEVEVYSEGLALTTSMQSFKHEEPSGIFSDFSGSTAPQAVENANKQDNKSGDRGGDPMLYFAAPAPASSTQPSISQVVPSASITESAFACPGNDFLHIKVEPGLEQQQQHHQQQTHPNSASHYAMERQHPFDPSPMLQPQQQQQHHHPQQQPYGRIPFSHGNPVLVAEFSYRHQTHAQQQQQQQQQ